MDSKSNIPDLGNSKQNLIPQIISPYPLTQYTGQPHSSSWADPNAWSHTIPFGSRPPKANPLAHSVGSTFKTQSECLLQSVCLLFQSLPSYPTGTIAVDSLSCCFLPCLLPQSVLGTAEYPCRNITFPKLPTEASQWPGPVLSSGSLGPCILPLPKPYPYTSH